MQRSWAGALGALGFVCAASACSGDEFSSGTGARGGSAGSAGAAGSSGSSATGGSSGSGGSATGGNGGASGAAGTGNGGSAGNGGDGGVAGSSGATGGSGGGTPECGPVPGKGLALYTTLDDEGSITAPASGNPASAAFYPADFHSGKCGAALMIDASGDYVRFAEPQNILYTTGTIDFWLYPKNSELDGVQRTYVESSGFGTTAGVLVRKLGAGNANAFIVRFSDKLGVEYETRVSDSGYDLAPNTWIRITVTWDFTVSGAHAVRVYFDGVEPGYAAMVVGPKDMTLNSTSGLLFVANDADAATAPVGGLIDDFKIYNSVVTP
jgi:hypothetical protein